jgi:hypothetical protein
MRGLGGPRKPTANVMGDRNECDRSGYGLTEQLETAQLRDWKV